MVLNKNIAMEIDYEGKVYRMTKEEFKKDHCCYGGECDVFDTYDGRKDICPICNWFIKFDMPKILGKLRDSST